MNKFNKKYIDELSYKIIGAAIEVHKELGPGLLESVYEKCLAHLLKEKGHSVRTQASVPVLFQNIEIDTELRLDLLVDNLVIVELKTVESILPIHKAQLLTYLRLLEKPKGILINFNCINLFKEGQQTFVSEFYKELPRE
jgi:GxxExxY protein